MATALAEYAGINRHKTVLKTFRFSEEIMGLLEKEAEEEGTTINALAGSIVTHHLEWEVKAERFGFVELSKPTFKAMIEALDDEALERIGRDVIPDVWREKAEFWFQDSSAERVLDFLSLESRHLPYLQIEVRKRGSSRTIVFHHDLCPKWSVVMRCALNEVVRRIFLAQPTITGGGYDNHG